MRYGLLAFVVFLFVAVVLCIEGAYLWWNQYHGPGARRVDARIRSLSAGGHIAPEQMSILKARLLAGSPRLQQTLMRLPRVAMLDRWLEQSGSDWSVAQLLGYSLLLGIATAALATLLPLPWLPIAAAAMLASLLPAGHIATLRHRRLRRLEAQLPDAVDMISRALRAGHSLSGALGTVAQQIREPMGHEFRITFEEIHYGVPMQVALTNLARRVPVADLRYFVIAVLIQRDSGGNLAEVLDTIAALVRARLKLFDKIRVLSAEGRLSAWILALLPFGTAALISLLNPGFLTVLWEDPTGMRLAVGALMAMVVGVVWMRQIIRIRV